MGKIGIIVRREFNERVKKKSFIITTVLMPLFFVAIIGVSVYMATRTSDKVREIVVVDNSGLIGQNLEDSGVLKFRSSDKPFEEIRDENQPGIFGILVIGEDVVSNPRNIQFYTYEASTMTIESGVSSQIKKIIEDEKLKTYDIENLAQIMQDIETKVSIQTKELSASGEARDSSSELSMMIAYVFGFLIYMFVFMYGTMVMQGVIEEKSNKVMELMVSSVKPFQLMMGKIIGIASVALTQLLIWVVFIAVAGGAIVNFFMGDMVEAARAMSAGMPIDPSAMAIDLDTAAIINRVTDVKYLLTLTLGFLVYFIGGYLLYAAMYAAVGSAVDNEKDTSNLQLPITIPLILALVVMIGAMNDPHSPTAFWFSMIPFTSPIVMMARLPYGVPMWEMGLSIGLLFLTFVGVVWLAGKIYRVGIFMYGKKPSFAELWKWSKYKY